MTTPDEQQPPHGSTILRLGSSNVVAVRPGSAAGSPDLDHSALDLLAGFAYGRLTGTAVAVLPPRRVVDRALLEVDCPDVRLLRSPLPLGVLAILARKRHVTASIRGALDTVRSAARRDIAEYLERHTELQPAARSYLKSRRRKLATAAGRRRNAEDAAPRLRRRLVAPRLETGLNPAAELHAREQAFAAGIAPDEPIVALHVRERADGLDERVRKRHVLFGPDDSTQTGWVETHFDAIDFLVDRGYRVVRIGDSAAIPIRRRGVVDLAVSSIRTPLLELYCVFRSRFLVCGESGPHAVSYLTNTPLLMVNGTDPLGSYPIRADGILMMKTVIDRETDQTLDLDDFLSEEYLTHLRRPSRYQYIQNSAEEIFAAVQEMVDLLDARTSETVGQERFRHLATCTSVSLRHLQHVADHGADRGFIGEGRIARSQADAWVARAPGHLPSRVTAI